MADDSEYARQLPNEPLNPGRMLPQSMEDLKDHTATWVSIVDREAHTQDGGLVKGTRRRFRDLHNGRQEVTN